MPPKVDSGFVKVDSGNLPKLSMFMVLKYFTSNSKYAALEIRGVKTTLYISKIYKLYLLFYSVNLNKRKKY